MPNRLVRNVSTTTYFILCVFFSILIVTLFDSLKITSSVDEIITSNLTNIDLRKTNTHQAIIVKLDKEQLDSYDGFYWDNLLHALDKNEARFFIFTFNIDITKIDHKLLQKIVYATPKLINQSVDISKNNKNITLLNLAELEKIAQINNLIHNKIIVFSYNSHAKAADLILNEKNQVKKISLEKNWDAVINTLQSERHIYYPLPFFYYLFLIALAGLFLLLDDKFKNGRIVTYNLILSTAYITASSLIIKQQLIALPITAVIVLQWLTLIGVLVKKNEQHKHDIDKTLQYLSHQSTTLISPHDQAHSPQYWYQLAHFYYQLFNLKQLLIIEMDPMTKTFKELAGIHAHLADLKKATNYTEHTTLQQLPKNRFGIAKVGNLLTDKTQDSLQYVIALTHLGVDLGFIIFTPNLSGLNNLTKKSAVMIKLFSQQISQLLYHRHQWLEKAQHPQDKTTEDESFQKIKSKIQLLEKQQQYLENNLNALSTGSALFNLHGTLIYANTMIKEIALHLKMRLEKISIIDFIAKFSQLEKDTIKQMIFQSIIHKEPTQITCTQDAYQNGNISKKTRYALTLRYINYDHLATKSETTAMLLEIIKL